MFQLFSLGHTILDMVNKVGDWLLYTPETITYYNPLLSEVVTIENHFGNVATLIIGGGLIGILGFRLVKFFVDIVL